jgi:hypothetical protein
MYIGRIEAEPPGIERAKWLALVDSHPHLRTRTGTPHMGISPFTRKPTEFKPRRRTGIVDVGGGDIGTIDWAMDGSPMLLVNAEDGSTDAVIPIAEQIAAALQGHFVREEDFG